MRLEANKQINTNQSQRIQNIKMEEEKFLTALNQIQIWSSQIGIQQIFSIKNKNYFLLSQNQQKNIFIYKLQQSDYNYIIAKLDKRMSQRDNQKQETPQSLAMGQKLVEAARNLNLAEIKSLILQGANINHIARTRSDGWYSGDSHTPLSAACEASFTDENLYINVIQYLLQNGAELHFKMLRGNWSRSSNYSIVGQLPQNIEKFSKQQNKVKLIKILCKHGLDVNKVDMIHNEYRNGYSKYNFTFGTKMVDFCYLKLKISELQKIYSFDSYKIQKEKSEQLKKMFNIIMPEEEDQRSLPQNNIQNQWQHSKENKQPNFAFIEELLQLGVDPNSLNSQMTVSGGGFGERGGYYRKQQKCNIFHRAIMNNSLKLVQKCLQKGADVNKVCTITVKKPIYPFQWSEDVIQQKIQNNKNFIQQYENRKTTVQNNLEEHLRTQNIEKIREFKRQLREVKFSIFKAKKFSIQNEVPTTEYTTKKLNCFQIAEALNVSSDIIEVIKKHQQSSPPNDKT